MSYYFSIDGHSKVALHSDEIKHIASNIWVVLPDRSHLYLACLDAHQRRYPPGDGKSCIIIDWGQIIFPVGNVSLLQMHRRAKVGSDFRRFHMNFPELTLMYEHLDLMSASLTEVNPPQTQKLKQQFNHGSEKSTLHLLLLILQYI